jgi:hypothetical protein
MNKKQLIFGSVILLLFLLTSPIFAYQFEDYEWGKSWEEIKAKVENRNANVNVVTEKSQLVFNDKILSRDCEVTLAFTPKSKLLWIAEIHWNDINIGDSVKAMLIKKDGEPEKKDDNNKDYMWGTSISETSIFLNYLNKDVSLVYLNTKYYGMFESEMTELYGAPLTE